MIELGFEYVNDFSDLNERIKAALADKMVELTQLLYQKVEANVSGKILQKKSGALAAKIAAGTEIDTASNPMTAFVGPADPGPKEYALERGGEKSYVIYPTKARALSFYWEQIGKRAAFASVNHPPSKAFHYLQEAADEMEELVPEGFAEAIDRALSGRI